MSADVPWFKVDDNLAFHHKAVAAGNSAMGLWVRAGSWAAQQLTDGFVPDHMIATLGTRSQAQRLVSVGLWAKVERGYEFHEWNERQPLKESVEAERAAARERMARRRAKPQGSGLGSGDVQANTSGTSGDVQVPRPDPTRPEGSKEPSGAASKSRKKPSSRLPEGWQPTDEHEARCAQDGIDLATQVARFKAHADANDRRQVNWNAAFTQWLLNVPEWQRNVSTGRTGPGFPVNGTREEQDAWVKAQPLPTDGAYYGGSAR